jgi:hypothetical protein
MKMISESGSHFEQRLSVQAVLSILTILETLETKQENALRVDLFLVLVQFLVQRSSQISDPNNKNGQVAFKYALSILVKLLKGNSKSMGDMKFDMRCVASLVLQTIQRNDRETDTLLKQTL